MVIYPIQSIRLRNYRTKDLRYFYLHGQVIPPRVKDYKKYLFDYHKELTISMENLNRIQIHGLSQFLSAVSK